MGTAYRVRLQSSFRTHPNQLSGIYALVDVALTSDVFDVLDAVLAAGVRLVQYRAKSGVERDVVRRMHARTQAAGALLIVNDDPEAALDADGLHVGQEDLALLDARALRAALGSRVLGISCSTPGEALSAAALGADYVGVGPFAATRTKEDAGEPIGESGVRRVVEATALPVAAIGGIDLENLAGVVRAGAAMAAVVSAISRGPNPEANARALVARWSELVP